MTSNEIIYRAVRLELTCRLPYFGACKGLYEKPHNFPDQVQRFVIT